MLVSVHKSFCQLVDGSRHLGSLKVSPSSFFQFAYLLPLVEADTFCSSLTLLLARGREMEL